MNSLFQRAGNSRFFPFYLSDLWRGRGRITPRFAGNSLKNGAEQGISAAGQTAEDKRYQQLECGIIHDSAISEYRVACRTDLFFHSRITWPTP